MIRAHIAHCYENLCREYTRSRAGELDCIRIGRQWGKQYEIDVAGVSMDNELVVAGECKWSSKKVGMSIVNKLKDTITSNHLPIADTCRFLLFSRSGFTDDLTDLAEKNGNIELVSSIFS